MNDSVVSRNDIMPGSEETIALARRTFNPHWPIANPELFFGRRPQLGKGLDAIATPGKNLVIYGSRGIGKTSLANILKDRAENAGYVVVSYLCDSLSNYKSVVKGLLCQLYHAKNRIVPGFVSQDELERVSLAVYLEGDSSPSRVVRILGETGGRVLLLIDEFDLLSAKHRSNAADLIKASSDLGADLIKIAIVGVGETIDDLIASHRSVERNISQIGLDPMEKAEIVQLIESGAREIGISFEANVIEHIVECSQGFPYFAQLLGQHSSVQALRGGSAHVSDFHFRSALSLAIDDVNRSIRRAYLSAVFPDRSSRFAQVLYHASIAPRDEFGFFSVKSFSNSGSESLVVSISDGALRYSLSKLTEQSRGAVLKRHETWRSYFRFSNPLMRQFVIMERMASQRMATS